MFTKVFTCPGPDYLVSHILSKEFVWNVNLLFISGAVENKVHTNCYNAEDEDFSGHGSTKLNTWVFDKVEKFFETARTDAILNETLNRQGVVLFLHLLGPDVAGHASKPHSR